MTDDGYTLAEMLVALLIIGLTAAALTSVVGVIGHLQADTARRAAASGAERVLQLTLSNLLRDAGPFASDAPAGLSGGAQGFDFDCAGMSCGGQVVNNKGKLAVRLALHGSQRLLPAPGVQSAHFVYQGSEGPSPVWPPVRAHQETLEAVSLMAGEGASERPLASARVWRRSPAACLYDPISGACAPAQP